MPTCLIAPPKVSAAPIFLSSGSGTTTTGGASMSPQCTVNVAQAGGCIVALTCRHTNWNNTLTAKTVVSNLGSTFTEIPGSDTVRGVSGQRLGHVVLFYCQNPAIGLHTLTGNVQAAQAFTRANILGAFYGNVIGYQNLNTQSTTGNAAVNLSITSNAGNIPFIGVATGSAMAGWNWTNRETQDSDSNLIGDRGITAVTGAVAFTTTSASHSVAAAGVDLIAA